MCKRLLLAISLIIFGACIEKNGGNGEIDAGVTVCTSDKQCINQNKICDPLQNQCVDCLFDRDCGEGEHCQSYKCVSYTLCQSLQECLSVDDKPICSDELGECVECVTVADCGVYKDCINNICVSFTSCRNSKDCINQVCSIDEGKCVDCLTNDDCKENEECIDQICKLYIPCKSDKECTAYGMLCDKGSEKCKVCLQHADCPLVYHCEEGECVIDVCAQGQSKCVNNGVAECNNVGDGFDSPISCEANKQCVQDGWTAKCESITILDGGVSDGNVVDAEQLDFTAPDISKDAPSDIATANGWVTVLAGTFMMGSPLSEKCRDTDETEHQVILTHSFYISAYEVTQGDFQQLMGYNPSSFSSCSSNCPVEMVNWYEAAAYCNALSSQKGLTNCYSCSGSGTSVICSEAAAYSGANIYNCPGYRLSTEAEWEYAYRAGTTSAFYNGGITSCSGPDTNADQIGWYKQNCAVTYLGCVDNSSTGGPNCAGTHQVGQKQSNAWALYDMAGNVWEWCHDWYKTDLGSLSVTNPWGPTSGYSKVVRGGSWDHLPIIMRAAARHMNTPVYKNNYLGFRVAQTKNP